jgi:hypothetical protein
LDHFDQKQSGQSNNGKTSENKPAQVSKSVIVPEIREEHEHEKDGKKIQAPSAYQKQFQQV